MFDAAEAIIAPALHNLPIPPPPVTRTHGNAALQALGTTALVAASHATQTRTAAPSAARSEGVAPRKGSGREARGHDTQHCAHAVQPQFRQW